MAQSSSRRLVLLDPGFNSSLGHHADLNGLITPALIDAGWSAEIWADVAVAGNPLLSKQLLGLRPVLREAGYIDPRHWCDLAGRLHQAGLLRPQLTKAAEGPAVQAWLAHSLLPFQLIAMAQVLQHQPPAMVVLSLMFAPGEVLGGQSTFSMADQRLAAELNTRTAVAALSRAAQQAGHHLILAAASQALIDRYAPLCAAAGIPVPELHPSPLVDTKLLGATAAIEPAQILLHWGERKPDKGRDVALAVLKELLQDPPLPKALQGIQWCLHASSREPATPAEQELLQRAARHPQIRILEGSTSREQMLHELKRCSAALLAYSPVAYAERSSGVFWLYAAIRLACGRPAPVVTPRGGWLWREAEAFGLPCVELPRHVTGSQALQLLAEAVRLAPNTPTLTTYGQTIVGQPWDEWLVNQLQAVKLD